MKLKTESCRRLPVIMLLSMFILSCQSKSEKAAVAKSIQNPKLIQGAWYLYDIENNGIIGKTPLFEIRPQQKFLDSAEILCHIHKLNAGEIIDLLRRHAGSDSSKKKLTGCPEYSYEGNDSQILIFNPSQSDDTPIIALNITDLKRIAKLQDGKTGHLYYLHSEVKQSRRSTFFMTPEPESPKQNPLSVILIRSP